MRRVKRFILLDDHPVFREGLKSLIETNENYNVLAQAGTISEVLDNTNKYRPDCILADISLSKQNGLNFIRNMKKTSPDIPILVVSMFDERIYAERSLRAGARGYVMKQEPSFIILNAINTVLEGTIYLSESMRDRIIENLASSHHADTVYPIETLSEREKDVLEYIGGGYGVSEIARLLYLSVKTINTYRDHIKEKLQLDNAAEIRRFAIHWLQARSS